MAWTDDPLSKSVPIKAVHINELRHAIEQVPSVTVLPWGTGNRVTTADHIRAQDMLDLRSAIGPGSAPGTVWNVRGYAAGAMLWTQSVPGSSTPNVIRATHVDDLRRWFDSAAPGATGYEFPLVRPLLFGINPSWAAWQQNPQYTDDAMMAKIKAAGAACIRSGIDWANVQPHGRGTEYVWDIYDARVNLALQNGLAFVAVVGTAPAWAVDPGNVQLQMPPLSQYRSDFQSFVTAVAQRYRGQIHHYEFNNEPDGSNGWYNPNPDATTYVPFLQMFSAAIKAVDDTAWVSTGGVSNLSAGAGLRFVQGIYTSGGQPYFDAVAGHPYEPNNGPLDAAGIQNLRNTMVAQADTYKPIWLTEYGWSVLSTTCPGALDPSVQNSYLQDALNAVTAASSSYVTMATFQLIADIPHSATCMGLLDETLDSKSRATPAYPTFSGWNKPTT